MKYCGKIFWSLFLISFFGAGTTVRVQDLNVNLEFVQNAKRFASAIWNETLEQRSRFSIKANDGTLQPEARNLFARVVEVTNTFDELIGTYAESVRGVSWNCDYNKAAYNNLTKLDINSPIKDKISYLSNAIDATIQYSAGMQELINMSYEKITNISANLVLMRWELKTLGYVNKTQDTEKLIENSNAYVEWLKKACSEFRTALRADQELVTRLEGTAQTQVAVINWVEKVSPGLQLSKKKIVYLSDKITSALREISDVCVEVKSD